VQNWTLRYRDRKNHLRHKLWLEVLQLYRSTQWTVTLNLNKSWFPCRTTTWGFQLVIVDRCFVTLRHYNREKELNGHSVGCWNYRFHEYYGAMALFVTLSVVVRWRNWVRSAALTELTLSTVDELLPPRVASPLTCECSDWLSTEHGRCTGEGRPLFPLNRQAASHLTLGYGLWP